MTWRALTVAQFVIAVVKISASRGTSPTRCLLPLSIHAPVRNVLGRLVPNKKEVPYFILMHRLWRFAYLFVLPFEKLQEQSLSRYACLSEHQQGLVFVIVTLGMF